MPETPVTLLDSRNQRMVERARAALAAGNCHYAAELCAQVLAAEPGCPAVRRLQRAALLRKSGGQPCWRTRVIGRLRTALLSLRKARRTPREQLEIAGEILAKDPTNVTALQLFAEAARRLDMPETAAFAREAVWNLSPGDRDNLLALGTVWLEGNRPHEALRVADELLRTNPVDGDARDLMRRASIAEAAADGIR